MITNTKNDEFTRYTTNGSLSIESNATASAAIMYTLIESCRLQNIDPRAIAPQLKIH